MKEGTRVASNERRLIRKDDDNHNKIDQLHDILNVVSVSVLLL